MSLEDPYSFEDLPGAGGGSQFEKAAKQVVNEILEYTRKLAWFLSQEIKAESRSIAAEQLNLTSDKLDIFAEALEKAVERLRDKQSNSLADIVEAGSKNMTRLSQKLSESNPEKIMADVENFGRRQPGIFLGAAVVSGFILGQLFSSLDGREDTVREFHPGNESSIGYRPEMDEEEHRERH